MNLHYRSRSRSRNRNRSRSRSLARQHRGNRRSRGRLARSRHASVLGRRSQRRRRLARGRRVGVHDAAAAAQDAVVGEGGRGAVLEEVAADEVRDVADDAGDARRDVRVHADDAVLDHGQRGRRRRHDLLDDADDHLAALHDLAEDGRHERRQRPDERGQRVEVVLDLVDDGRGQLLDDVGDVAVQHLAEEDGGALLVGEELVGCDVADGVEDVVEAVGVLDALEDVTGNAVSLGPELLLLGLRIGKAKG